MSELVQLLANGLVEGSVIALAAVGVSLVYGTLRIVNFAHGDYLTFGAYMALLVNVHWGRAIAWATIFAVVVTAALSILLEFVLWRPMRRRGAKFVSLFVTSIGLALVLRSLMLLVGGAAQHTYAVNVFQVYSWHGIRLSESQVIAVGISIAAIVLLAIALARSTIGRSMRALSDNSELASVAGIDVDRVVSITWLVAGGLAGLAGVLAGLIQTSFDPNLGFTLLLPVFAAVVVGGIGSAYGALVGGLLLGLVEELSTWTHLAGGVNPTYKPVVAFVVLIAVLLVRPTGILGRARTV